MTFSVEGMLAAVDTPADGGVGYSPTTLSALVNLKVASAILQVQLICL